jgi:5-methylcytosine-specific restriction enzyme subunit McrC
LRRAVGAVGACRAAVRARDRRVGAADPTAAGDLLKGGRVRPLACAAAPVLPGSAGRCRFGDSAPISDLRYDRLNDHYRRAIHLAHLIIQRVSFRLGPGSTAAPSFLVNMNSVFQDYVTTVFEEQASRQGLIRCKWADYRLDISGEIPLIPDIVFSDEDGCIRAVLDVKYKCSDAKADCYQALAYAKGLGVKRVALIYPADGEVTPATYAVVNDDVEILVRTLPVGPGGAGFFSQLESRVGATVRAVLAELVPANSTP